MSKQKDGIRKRKNENRWEYRYRVDGKRISLYAPTKKELEKKIEDLKHQKDRGVNLSKNKITLNEMYDIWIESKEFEIKDSTLSNYSYMYETFVRNSFGRKRLSDIKRMDVKKYYIKLLEDGSMKINTLDSVQTVLHQVFDFAVDDCYISVNPSERILKPLKKKYNSNVKRVVLSELQEKCILDYLQKNKRFYKYYIIVKFLIITGLRIGELGALQVSDIDLEARTFTINKTIAKAKDKTTGKHYYVIHSTAKTKSGNRVLYLTDDLIDLIKKEFNYQKELGLKCLDNLNGYDDFLFISPKGHFIQGSTVNKVLYEVVDKINASGGIEYEGKMVLIPKQSCHRFRHLCNSKMMQKDIAVEKRMAILGQSDIDVNVKIYTHVSFDDIKRTMETMR